jgi:hypothetical protein
MAAVMLARRRASDEDGARDRTVHLVPIPDAQRMPAFLTAWCGAQFTPGAVEVLPTYGGMPCEQCLDSAPMPTARTADAGV